MSTNIRSKAELLREIGFSNVLFHGVAHLAVGGQFGKTRERIEAIARSASETLIHGLSA